MMMVSIIIDELEQYYKPMQAMLSIAPEIAEREIQALIKRLGADNDGTISFEDMSFSSIYMLNNFVFCRIQVILLKNLYVSMNSSTSRHIFEKDH